MICFYREKKTVVDHIFFIYFFFCRRTQLLSVEKSPRRRNENKDKRNEAAASSSVDNGLNSTFTPLSIELEPNASKFCIFSTVRSAVLEAETKLASGNGNPTKKASVKFSCCSECLAACRNDSTYDCRCHFNGCVRPAHPSDPNDSDADSESEATIEKEIVQKVPQIVGAGLKSLFELIAEARNVHPTLCSKALRALLDVIQGQTPESFKSEPGDLIDALYDMLLDLATLHGPGPSEKIDTNNWSSIGCSSLLGLAVARGDTGKILKAVAALLMSPKLLSQQNIQLPIVLSTLQRSVQSVALNKAVRPDYFKHGIPVNSVVDQFSLKNQLPRVIQYNLQPAIACDGKFIYILVSRVLLKVGSGFNGSLKGHVYASNHGFQKDKNGWIGWSNVRIFSSFIKCK